MKKRKVILGAGESGVGAALLAKAKGFETFVSDKGAIADYYKRILKENHIDFEEGKHTEHQVLNAGEVIKSPGIPDNTDLILKLKANKVAIISEIEFAARYTQAKFVAITGTNGKTTTTLLAYHLIKNAGFNVGLAGNIGTSLAKQVIDDPHDIYVLELSSFQLDGMVDFKADVSILLNITPDHMDRYEYRMENYIDSKFRIINNTGPKDFFIYYTDSKIVNKEVEKRSIEAGKLPISLQQKVDEGAYFFQEEIHVVFGGKRFSVSIDDISIKGRHNLINSMAAALAAKAVGTEDDSIKEGLKDFVNAPHRLEPVATINGVRFINDSKATNVDSVYYALDSFKEKLVWIAGGIDKGNDYHLIEDLVLNKVKTLVCLGKDNSKLLHAFSGKLKEVKDTNNLNQAIQEAFKAASPGDVVLLSPACASFDLFKNYEDRGEQFKQAVLSMKESL